MSATEALDAYLERQQSSKKASSCARAAGKQQEPPRAAANPPARLPKASDSASKPRSMAKGPLLKAGAPRAGDRAREGVIKAVWPPSPLDEKDDRPLLAKAHPATARTAQRKPSEAAASGDQGGALSKLKRLSSSRLRNASGASPREQLGADSAQPDHFAAALEKLRRDRPAEKQNPQQQGAGHKASSKAPGEGSQESPGQQRRARWDPMADTEDRLALQRLTQKAAALSAHPSPTKGQRREDDSQQHAEGAISFSGQLRLALSAAPARAEGLRSRAQDSAQAQQAKENAEVLNEVLSELRAAEERSNEQQGTSTGPSSLTQAAYQEASALGAVTAWYRDVQRKHAAAGLGDDPIIASILPGSSKKLSQRNTPPDRDAQTEQPDGSEAGPLLKALMASLPRVPDMPKKAPAKLPVIHSVSASPQQQSQGDDHAAAAPPADFAAKFSSLAEDMPRLRRDTYLQAGGQDAKPSSAGASPQPEEAASHPMLPLQQEVEEPPAMPRQSPAAAPAPIIASAPVPQAAQHIPSSVGRDLAFLQQRWQGFHEPPPPQPIVNSSVPSRETVPHHGTGAAVPHQHSVGQQQHSSSLPLRASDAVPGAPAHSHMDVSPPPQQAGGRVEPDLQRQPISAEAPAAPLLSPLSAFSPVIGTPVEYYAYSAPPAADVMGSGSGFSYQAATSPGAHMHGKYPSGMPQAPLSHSSIRQLWGHPERKEGGQEPWAAGPGGLDTAWAAHDRIASAMVDSQPRGSPAHLSEVELPRHSVASDLMGFNSGAADCLTEGNGSLRGPESDRSPSHASLLQHSGSSMSVSSSSSHGASRMFFGGLPATASSMDCASNASRTAGALDALLADALSQDDDEMHDMLVLPAGLGALAHELDAGVSGRPLPEGLAEAAGMEPGLATSRPGSSRASLVAHYMQRGRAASRAASSGARQGHNLAAYQ